MKSSLETKKGPVAIAASSAESLPTENEQSKVEKPVKAKVQTVEDLFEPREDASVARAQRVATNLTGPYLQSRQFDAEIKPKNAGHLQFLRGCTSYEGTDTLGKVRANIDMKFWSWVSKLDPAEIRQAYIDAAVIRGEASSSAANAVLLVQQAGIGTDWDAATITKIEKCRQEALKELKQVYADKGGKKLVHHSKKSKTAYAKLTDGDLKYDYPVYRRSVRFCEKIVQASQLATPTMSHAAVKKLMKKDGHDGQAVVIAIDRLQRLFEQNTAL